MPDPKRPVLLVAGIAEGLGLSLAEVFAEAGHDVVGLARSGRVADAASSAVARAGGAYTHLRCDLCLFFLGQLLIQKLLLYQI